MKAYNFIKNAMKMIEKKGMYNLYLYIDDRNSKCIYLQDRYKPGPLVQYYQTMNDLIKER